MRVVPFLVFVVEDVVFDCPSPPSQPQQWLVDNPKEETASLLKEGAPRLRLCLSGKPIAPTRPLLKCVDGTHGPLELLPVKAGADASGSDSGDE